MVNTRCRMNRTENYIMWDCLIDIFKGEATKETELKVALFIQDYYLNEGREVNNNFSIDNWQIVLCWTYLFRPEKKKLVPLFGHHTKHPMKFIEMAWMKYWWLAPLKVLTVIDMAVRHLIIRRKTAQERYHTSGLLLDYYVFYSYDCKVMMWLLTKMMKTMFSNWGEVFFAYHGNPKHYNHKVYLAFKNRSKK